MIYEDGDGLDFGNAGAQTYNKECECGNLIEVSTQKDDERPCSPEYYTYVFVKCSCGKSVKFNLPVG